MSDGRPDDGIPGWDRTSGARRNQSSRQAPYGRAIAWAVLVWAISVAVIYVVAQVLLQPRLGGWLGLAGFILGTWIGGVQAGISGRREWAVLIVLVLGLLVFAIGFGSCMYAMALYG